MNVQIEKLLVPVQELAALNVASLEKIVNLQLETLAESATVGVEALKQAAAIKDVEGAKKYFTGQAEVAKAAVESATERAGKVAEIAQTYQAGVSKIVGNTIAVN